MQKTSTMSDNCRQKDRTESESYAGVQTFIGITENHLVEVQFTKDDLLERIVSPANMNRAYKQVVSNGGSGGVDKMETEDLLPYLKLHKDELITSLLDGSYRPHPVRRVEIPKGGGKKRQLGIPTVIDRLIQQSISQVLSSLYSTNVNSATTALASALNAVLTTPCVVHNLILATVTNTVLTWTWKSSSTRLTTAS